MLPDQVSNPGPLTYESGALPIALRGPGLLLERGPYTIMQSQLFWFLALYFTLLCLNMWTPKTINFPFGTNGKLMVFKCPNT